MMFSIKTEFFDSIKWQVRKPHDFQSPLQGIFSYTKQLFPYVIMVLIGGDLMNAYLRIKEYNDSYTATEKLIAEYILENDILQDSAQEDNISTLVEKGCRLNMNTVLKTYQLIDIDTLEASIDLLNNSSTIYLFGVGGSSVIGLDIYQKLMRIGKKVIYNADLHVQMTFAQSMDQNDAALIISYSGSTTGLVDVARVLHEKQIPVISITQINSNPISKLSTYSLKVPNEEKPYVLVLSLLVSLHL